MLNSMGKIKKLRGVEGLALLGQIISEAPWQCQCRVQLVAPDEGGGTGDGTLGVEGTLLLGTS